MIVGFDTATKTGWAIYDNGKIIESGVARFEKSRTESNGMVFFRFRMWVRDLLLRLGPQNIQAVFFEAAHFRGAGTELLLGFQTRVQEVCATLGIEHSGVHSGTLKKWACGHGKADKAQMIIKAKEYLGREPETDDEADAVLLAVYGAEQIGDGGSDDWLS